MSRITELQVYTAFPGLSLDLLNSAPYMCAGLMRLALRTERLRGVNGHWAYSRSRHAGMQHIFKAHCAKHGIAL